jgi:hypothetical protein
MNALGRILRRARRSRGRAAWGRRLHDLSRPKRRGCATRKAGGQRGDRHDRSESGHLKAPGTRRRRAPYQKEIVAQRTPVPRFRSSYQSVLRDFANAGSRIGTLTCSASGGRVHSASSCHGAQRTGPGVGITSPPAQVRFLYPHPGTAGPTDRHRIGSSGEAAKRSLGRATARHPVTCLSGAMAPS